MVWVVRITGAAVIALVLAWAYVFKHNLAFAPFSPTLAMLITVASSFAVGHGTRNRGTIVAITMLLIAGIVHFM